MAKSKKPSSSTPSPENPKSAATPSGMAVAGLPDGFLERMTLKFSDGERYRLLKYRDDLIASARHIRETRKQDVSADLLSACETAEAELLKIQPEKRKDFDAATFELSQTIDRINPLSGENPLKKLRLGRKLRKIRKHMLSQSKHQRRMREDLLDTELLARCEAAEKAFKATSPLDSAAFNAAAHELTLANREVVPLPKTGWRENVEIMVVAIAVALGFRTYILQPFKIPTGSMQPTLYGVTYGVGEDPGKLFHPLKIGDYDTSANIGERRRGLKLACFLNPAYTLRGFFTGKWWTQIKTAEGGTVSIMGGGRNGKFDRVSVGKNRYDSVTYNVPRGLTIHVKPGDVIEAGTVIASGNKESGDQILVNKIKYNFGRPERGDIFVFNVRDVEFGDMYGSDQHYIKRLVGLPGEVITVENDRRLYANGELIEEPDVFPKQYERQYSGMGRGQSPGFNGYDNRVPFNHNKDNLRKTPEGLQIDVSDTQYLPMGDNTQNSQDGRYFGGVERKDVTGPAFMVYWPFTRFGFTDSHADTKDIEPNP